MHKHFKTMINNQYKIASILLIAILFCCANIYAQETVEQPKVLDELLQTDSKDRLIVEVAHANWSNRPENTKMKWFSRAINLYLMYDIPITKNISFAPGAGVGTTVYSHNQSFNLNEEGTKTNITAISDSIMYDSNNLSTNFFDIPLELRFRTNPDKLGKRFKVAVGFKGGYLFNGHSKWNGPAKYNVSPDTEKIKNFNVPNLNNLRYGYTLRIGYSNFNLVGFYSAAPLFLIDKSSVTNGIKPFYIGFSFNSL